MAIRLFMMLAVAILAAGCTASPFGIEPYSGRASSSVRHSGTDSYLYVTSFDSRQNSGAILVYATGNRQPIQGDRVG